MIKPLYRAEWIAWERIVCVEPMAKRSLANASPTTLAVGVEGISIFNWLTVPIMRCGRGGFLVGEYLRDSQTGESFIELLKSKRPELFPGNEGM